MHPMPDVELAGLRRSLTEVAADTRLPTDTTRRIEGVIRAIQRLERNLPNLLPYLVSSIEAMCALLREIAPQVTTDGLGAEIESAVAATPDRTAESLDSLNQRHQELRGLLARAITADCPDPPAYRHRIIEALRADVDRRPW